MELVDTHCHLTFTGLIEDIEEVLARSLQAGVNSWVTVGTDPDQSKKAVALAERYTHMYAAVGLHPHYAKDGTAKTMDQLRELARSNKVVAIGETGLDFNDMDSPRGDQVSVFTEHCKIAKDFKLPVILHCRKAFSEILEILEQFKPLIKAVFHCFSGSVEQAQIVLNKGYYISFTGVVTFNNARRKRKAAEIVPLERLMLETDCPYMSPEPMRSHEPNEPAFMVHIARFLAKFKGMELVDFARAVTATSKAFFALPGESDLTIERIQYSKKM